MLYKLYINQLKLMFLNLYNSLIYGSESISPFAHII